MLTLTLFLNALNAEITVWHAMDGKLGEILSSLVKSYQEESKNTVNLVYKGKYEDILDKTTKVLGTSDAPHVVQISEFGTLTMSKQLDKEGQPKFIPIADLIKVPELHPCLSDFYKNYDDKLKSLPFNASTVVLFYNADKVKDLHEKPTFENIFNILKQQKSKFATGWFHGHWIDQNFARHNREIASAGNGINGPANLAIDKDFFVFNAEELKKYYDQGLLMLEDGQDAEDAFVKGDALFLANGSNRLPILKTKIKFKLGIVQFPYWNDASIKDKNIPYNTIAGGASFWVAKKDKEYDSQTENEIREFLEFLCSEKAQKQWCKESLYLPVLKSFYTDPQKTVDDLEIQDANAKQAWYTAISSYHTPNTKNAEYSRGILLPNYAEVRKLQKQYLQSAIKGEQTPDNAWDALQAEGNELLDKAKADGK